MKNECKSENCLHGYVNRCHRENECCSLEYKRQLLALQQELQEKERQIERMMRFNNCSFSSDNDYCEKHNEHRYDYENPKTCPCQHWKLKDYL